jgi:hypothetical protein
MLYSRGVIQTKKIPNGKGEKMTKTVKLAICAISMAAIVIISGCSTPRITDTSRTAVEQFLISTVVDRGIGSADFRLYNGKKMFIEYDYIAPQVDKQYVQGVFEMTLAKNGVIVTRDVKDADFIVQIICGVLATDTNKFTIGVPELPFPVPDTSLNIAIPEIPIFQKLTRTGFGKFSFNILEAATRKPRHAISGIEASTYYTNWIIMLIPFRSHDMPIKIREGTETTFDLGH